MDLFTDWVIIPPFPPPYGYGSVTDPIAVWMYWNLPIIMLGVFLLIAIIFLYIRFRMAEEQDNQNFDGATHSTGS